jgi:dTDP-4-amino-4,6-dideoxygalactose transaminase
MDLENMLGDLHQRQHAFLTGNGTSGIYLILKAAGFKNKNVAIPNSVCINVPLVIKFSGNNPVYLDISKDNLCLSVNELSMCKNKIDAFIAVHAYGSVCDIENISKYCGEENIFLIEDFAVAQGAEVNGRPVGSFGDASVVSFGAGKIIDVGHGGAVLSDDRNLMDKISNLGKKMGEFNDNKRRDVENLSKYVRELYNEHYGKDLNKFHGEFNRIAMGKKESFMFRFSSKYEDLIVNGINNLRENIKMREDNTFKLTEMLDRKNENIDIYKPPEGSVCWRYNLFVKKNRDGLLKYLLSKKYKISSWFPSADIFLEDRSAGNANTPISDWVGDHILNIWVNEEIDDDYLSNVSEDILKFFG